LTEGAIRQLKKNVNGGHYLCIQDTTEINFTSHMGRIGREDRDVGPLEGGIRPIQVFSAIRCL